MAAVSEGLHEYGDMGGRQKSDRSVTRCTQCVPVGILVLVVATMACRGTGSGDTEDGADQPGLHRHLLIVLDGLRPDYVTQELMPNLYALGQRGVVMTRHHAVYPTVTRVNASSISTGAYPTTHGLMGNAVFFPAVDPHRFLTSGDRANLLRVRDAEDGDLLTATTLAEALQAVGKRALVVSAGSTGSSFLLNPTVAGGAIIHYDYGLPESIHEQALQVLGGVPEAATPNDGRDQWVVDAFLRVGLPQVDPAVSLMWLSDPDATAHQHGVGHPTTIEALRRVDAEIKRIQDGLVELGLFDTTNIWVTSDHGFSEHTDSADLGGLLEPFSGTLDDGAPLVVAGSGAIYVRDGDRTTVAGIVAALQSTDGVGAVFTRAERVGESAGWVPGTLSFDVASWDHERSADILYSADWTGELNEYGYAGTTAQRGVAGHGSASPFDIHATFVAAGPDLKERLETDVPSGNVDFAPTFLHLLGVDIPSSMQGRVLFEVLKNGPDPSSVNVETTEVTVATSDGSYVLTATSSAVDGRSYLDSATVVR